MDGGGEVIHILSKDIEITDTSEYGGNLTKIF